MARHPISWNDIDKLEVDEATKRLFWHGNAVVMEQRLYLRGYELFLATIAATGALLGGVFPFGSTFGWW